MKQININRKPDGTVTFDPVSVDPTENVFFTNLDPEEAHWPYLNPNASSPDFCDNQLGPKPSPNSSQCPLPAPPNVKNPNPPPDQIPELPYKVNYFCKFHPGEQGTILMVAPLAAAKKTTLPAATVNQALPSPVPVVVGGASPYAISGKMFQVTDNSGNVIKKGSDSIGPGLQLNPDQQNNGGITVSGTPTLSGNYAFTFVVDDGTGGNLQQVQYSMKVSS